MNGMLDLHECSRYRFDEERASRPVRFIQTFLRHFRGQFDGQPFMLHPMQGRIIRDVYGWIDRDTDRRRFKSVYWEAGVGAGKSPLLAAIGLYELLAGGEAGAQIWSLASTFTQAKVVFDSGRKFVTTSPELELRLDVLDREIRARNGSWKVTSGKGAGAGANPSTVLVDELHDFAGPVAFNDLASRMSKRMQPTLWAATNAGKSRATFCWTMRERALAALAGDGDPTLYPVIWAADETGATDDPAAWRACNPLLDVTITTEAVRQKCLVAMRDPVDEADFRRLYLGHWPKTASAGRWLDLEQWDGATGTFNASELTGVPLFVGLDLSQGDDLCAATFLWAGAERWHIGSHFWMPFSTAVKYRERDGIPYFDWASRGGLTITMERTISDVVHKQIAAHVTAIASRQKTKAVVAYDAYRASATVAALESKGMTCVPIRQGYSLAPGCFEIERRLKEGSITIAPNDVMRFCAENTEVKADDRGNIWPVKPNANAATNYAGKRGLKIDGIAALVTAAVEARKQAFAPAKTWGGSITGLRNK